jgi:acyl carrier protein
MTKEEFLQEINSLMEREEELTEDMQLSALEAWDSMTILGVMALFDAKFNISLASEDFEQLTIVQDLVALTQGKLDE